MEYCNVLEPFSQRKKLTRIIKEVSKIRDLQAVKFFQPPKIYSYFQLKNIKLICCQNIDNIFLNKSVQN